MKMGTTASLCRYDAASEFASSYPHLAVPSRMCVAQVTVFQIDADGIARRTAVARGCRRTLQAARPYAACAVRSRFTHRFGRVLLQEVRAVHRHGLLVGPRAAKLALRADQEASGVGIDEQLGDRARRKPSRVGFNDANDVLGLTRNRQLTGPGQHRLA